MADLKISQLGSIVTVVPATDVLPVVQGGTTLKITPNQILGSGGTATLASATITGDLTVRTTGLIVNTTGVGIGVSPNAGLALTLNGEFGMLANNLFYWNGYYSGGFKARAAGYSGNVYVSGTGDFVISNTSTSAVGAGSAVTFRERYRIDKDGIHTWEYVGGVAGTAMTLNSTGLGIGRSPIAKLNVDKASQTPGGTTPNGAFVITDNAGSNLALEFGVNSANASYIQARNSTSATYYNLFLNPDGGNIAVGTTSSGGSISNTSQILAGIFSTLIGTASSVVTATPTTIFAAPSESTLMVTAYVAGAAPSDYKVVAVVKVSGGVVAITTISTATSITITASGTNVQVTQTSGGSQNVGFNVLRLA
jgi:hypothetical protein